jgi:hypothetical protein
MSSLKILKKILRSITPPIIYSIYLAWLNSTSRFEKGNRKLVENCPYDFEVLNFQYIDLEEKYDLKWGWWSRIYEYELVIDKINLLKDSGSVKIHNTCWGYHGTHILFKNELESRYSEVLNSDLLISNEPNTVVYNLKEKPNAKWVNQFDFVINVSTMEEIRYPHIQILYNLLNMTKVNGYVIATFDIPGLQLDMFEKLFGRKIKNANGRVTGDTSPYKMPEHGHLSVGYLVLKKLK